MHKLKNPKPLHHHQHPNPTQFINIMKNYKGLKVATKAPRNYFFWSVLGLFSITGWFSLKYFHSPPSTPNQILTNLTVEYLTIGVSGILLTLYSCCHYYLRLGIVPGILHSTICIPHWSSGQITFSVSNGLFFSLFSGLLFTSLYCSVSLSLYYLKESNILAFQIQTYASVLLLIYNYFTHNSKAKEVIGIFLLVALSHAVFLNYNQEISAGQVAIGTLLVGNVLASVGIVNQARKCIDSHSIGLLACFVFGIVGVVLLGVDYCVGNGKMEVFSVGKGAAFALFMYCFCWCSLSEVNVLIAYPCFCTALFQVQSAGSIIALVGATVGVVLAVFGDLPSVIYHRCRVVSIESPLNSPLLI